MIDLIGTLRRIHRNVGLALDLIRGLLILEETGGTLSTTGAEQDIYRVENPLGVFEPIKVQIDFTNNTAAETIRIRVYYRIAGWGNYVMKDEMVFAGVQSPALKNVELEPNRHGIRVTLQRLAGGAQNYDWAVFYRS